MQLEAQQFVQRKPGALWTPVDREAVILAENHYIALDDIGRRIWELLEQPERVDKLCESLSKEFKATPEQIAADVLPFLGELADEGLIQAVEPPSG
jgi:hypothetical protein